MLKISIKQINMTDKKFKSKVTFSTDLMNDIKNFISKYNSDKIFTLVDENTKAYCLPKLEFLQNTQIIEMKSGEENKTIETVTEIWKYFNLNKTDKKSLFINIGGGLLCDVGGFAASTFKRGMDYINIPTTLLAQVDASVGGKTGINFMHFKNEIGVINPPKDVFISPIFFASLDDKNILSGYAEMLKHALLDSENHLKELLDVDFRNSSETNILSLIEKSVAIKENIVVQDPFEKNIRKALNLGHTIGHAFESLAQRKKEVLFHGEAVALGLISELYLSVKKCGFPDSKYLKFIEIVKSKYPFFNFSIDEIETLIEIMYHDKKNDGGEILFTLLENFGKPLINQKCSENEIKESLEEYLKI
jgi:3-dehydroquinate synthase